MTDPTAASAGQSPADAVNELALLKPIETEGSVGVVEVVRLALESLTANKVRSLLTMLGVIIGVASVVALLAIGGGASQAITSQVESIGTNIITLVPGSRKSDAQATAAQSMTMDDANAISSLNLPISDVTPAFNSSAQIVAPAADTSGAILGTTPAYQALNDLTLLSGTFLDAGQVSSASSVIVLGSKLANTLFGTGQAVGQTVRVGGQSLRVIGVLNAKGGGGFGSVDDRAFVPITFAYQHFAGARTPDGNAYLVSSISLSVVASSDMTAVQGRIAALLRERHHLKADGTEDDFIVFNQAALLTTLTGITSILTAFLGAIAGISLVVGGIGIMNIMLVSVTERTKEIGLRKAVGARSQDILLQFIVEAIVISLAGGLIGLALATVVTAIITATGVLSAPVTPSSVVIAVSFSMAVGLFFGIYPAQRAARLNPIDALRFE